VSWLLALPEILDWAEKMLIYLKHFDERKKDYGLGTCAPFQLPLLPLSLSIPVRLQLLPPKTWTRIVSYGWFKLPKFNRRRDTQDNDT
jgi:hypothetical protein